MRWIKHLSTWLLLLTVITVSGLVSAKVASGSQNLSSGLHQAETGFNSLIRLGKIDFSYDDVSGSSVVPKSGTETVQRAMSRGELEAIQNSGLLSRGGRPGPHFASDSVNSTANRARQRLALPGSPEVRVTMDVPKGVFSSPSKVKPDFNMPGGGMERTASGHLDIPATIRRVDDL